MKSRNVKALLKRVAAFVLVGTMVLGMTACGTKEESKDAPAADAAGDVAEEEGKDLSWLHPAATSADFPIVDEGTEKTLKVFVKMNTDSAEPEDTWMYDFITDGMNINLEVTKFTDENASEFLSLAFASGELPDIIIGGGFTTTQLVNYGTIEGQLMDIAPYITEEIMPNLSAIYAENPSYMSAVQDGDGHVWSLGYIKPSSDPQYISRAMINYEWLDEVGMDVPETLDEFLEVLRAFKAKDSNAVAMGGSYENRNPMGYVLNALGYITNDATGTSIALRNGEVVLPVADREAYGAFLEFMNTCYAEGLIHPDFFTMDDDTVTSMMTEERVGFFADVPYIWAANYTDFWGALPLTSAYNSTAQWPASTTSVTAGGAVICADCEEPELACAFLDYWYKNHNQRVYVEGPSVVLEEGYLYDVSGYEYDVETNSRNYADLDGTKWDSNNKNEYLNEMVRLWAGTPFGYGDTDGSEDVIGKKARVYPTVELDKAYDELTESDELLADGNLHFMYAEYYTLCQNLTDEVYPTNVYLDEESTEEANSLSIVIKEFATKEMAKFITGARSLDELDQYFDEIEELGAAEYVQIYADYYNNMK